MDDREITKHINQLVDEEHRLEESHLGKALSSDETNRLTSIGVELDQCWDLLRQRRARRAAGQNPNEADVRATRTVEGYQQ